MSEDARGQGAIAVCVVVIASSSVAIALRSWARLLQPNVKQWWDDWLLILSLAFVCSLAGTTIRQRNLGMGNHVWDIPYDDVVQIAQINYANLYLFDMAIALPKLSALLFYWRVFGHTSKKSLRFGIVFGFGIITAYLIGVMFANIFQCTPIGRAWDRNIHGTCISFYGFLLAKAIIGVILDIYVLVLPLPSVWRLHVGRKRKLILLGVFITGYCVIAVSLGRLVSCALAGRSIEADPTWAFVPQMYWYLMETTLCIMSVSVPRVFFLFKRAHEFGFRWLFTTKDPEAVASTSGSPRKSQSQRFSQSRPFTFMDVERQLSDSSERRGNLKDRLEDHNMSGATSFQSSTGNHAET